MIETRAELAEHLVSGLMSVAIVDLLEVIDVGHHQRERPAEPRGALDFARKLLLEEPAAARSRELVDGRKDAIVRERQLQGGRETHDPARCRQMRPELFA